MDQSHNDSVASRLIARIAEEGLQGRTIDQAVSDILNESISSQILPIEETDEDFERSLAFRREMSECLGLDMDTCLELERLEREQRKSMK